MTTTRQPQPAPRQRTVTRGSVTVELVVLTPVLVVVLLWLVMLGRAGDAVQDVHHAAAVAARAGSLVSASRARRVAVQTAHDDLHDAGRVCATIAVDVAMRSDNGLRFITVRIRCEIDEQALASLFAPRTVTATSTEVVDRFRGGAP